MKTIYRKIRDRQGRQHLISYRVAFGTVVSVDVYDNVQGRMISRIIGQLPYVTIGRYEVHPSALREADEVSTEELEAASEILDRFENG